MSKDHVLEYLCNLPDHDDRICFKEVWWDEAWWSITNPELSDLLQKFPDAGIQFRFLDRDEI